MDAKSIRFLCQSREVEQRLSDRSTGAVPAIWAGDETTVDVFFLKRDGTAEGDFSSITLFQLEVLTRTGELLLLKTLEPDDVVDSTTLEEFNAGTAQHLRFALTSADTTFSGAPAGPRQALSLALCLKRPGAGRVTLATSSLWVHRALHDGGGIPPAPPDLYYKAAEVDALLAGLGGGAGLPVGALLLFDHDASYFAARTQAGAHVAYLPKHDLP